MRKTEITLIIFIFLLNANFINSEEENIDNNKEILQKNNIKNNQNIISKIELSHTTPIIYFSGANKPSFNYGFVFNYSLPIKSKYKIFNQNNFNVYFFNQTSLTMDKIGLNFSITPIVFVELNTGFSTIFVWKFFGNEGFLKKGESLNDTNGEGTEGIGFNFDFGINLKFNFNYFFPKVKLGFLNKSLFNYIFFPGIDFWELNQYKTMLKDSWIFNNDFMVMWNEKIFAPYLILNTTYFFEKPDAFLLSVGGGIQLIFEKPGMSFNANTIVFLLPEEISRNIRIMFMIKHTFIKKVWNKQNLLK